MKKTLKAYLFSGVFSYRAANNLTKYSHLCVLDIDDLTEKRMNLLKMALAEDPFVFAFWVSPRGEGIKGLIQFKFSQEPKPSDYATIHSRAFDSVLNYFAANYDILLDKGRDVSRLCFTSADGQLILKEKFLQFNVNTEELIKEAEKQPKQNKERRAVVYDEKLVRYIQRPTSAKKRREIQSVIKFLEKKNTSITSSYNDWFYVAKAISNEFSYNIGKKYFLRLCELDGEKHSESESIKKLIECYRNVTRYNGKPITIYTIVYFARKKGYTGNKKYSSSEPALVEKA